MKMLKMHKLFSLNDFELCYDIQVLQSLDIMITYLNS